MAFGKSGEPGAGPVRGWRLSRLYLYAGFAVATVLSPGFGCLVWAFGVCTSGLGPGAIESLFLVQPKAGFERHCLEGFCYSGQCV